MILVVPSDGPPPQPSCPTLEPPHLTVGLGDDHQPQPHPHNSTQETLSGLVSPSPSPSIHHHPRPHESHPPTNPEWLSLLMSFCFAAMSMAFQTLSTRPPKHLSLSFHVAGLGVVFALATFVLCKYIPAVRMRREAQFLENMGVFFGITAFFLDITIYFPLCLKFWFSIEVHGQTFSFLGNLLLASYNPLFPLKFKSLLQAIIFVCRQQWQMSRLNEFLKGY
ncbi:hypothetical protein M9H77_28895 [Catharanthus roseus]|uniref:Uncharacterized protein n=1 Tax=Catharanthus roseus TaxID=4058 RepID=A0ACC0AGM4_CATRO|nr:hypothetical protein M9H77_28895 [Catharanthus roseus]